MAIHKNNIKDYSNTCADLTLQGHWWALKQQSTKQSQLKDHMFCSVEDIF